jgi:hypothetical protein
LEIVGDRQLLGDEFAKEPGERHDSAGEDVWPGERFAEAGSIDGQGDLREEEGVPGGVVQDVEAEELVLEMDIDLGDDGAEEERLLAEDTADIEAVEADALILTCEGWINSVSMLHVGHVNRSCSFLAYGISSLLFATAVKRACSALREDRATR